MGTRLRRSAHPTHLFIAGEAFPRPADFAAATIAVFLASIIAGTAGTLILWLRKAG